MDTRNYEVLLQNGWQVIVLWECQLISAKLEYTMQQTAVALNENYIKIVKDNQNSLKAGIVEHSKYLGQL